MKVKLTKEKVIQIHNALSEIGNEKENSKFSYAVARNLNAIESEVKALTKAQTISKEYQEYDAERLKICREMAKKDENGAPIMIGEQFKEVMNGPMQRVGGEFDIEDRTTFDKKIEKLQKKNKVIIDVQTVRIEQFNELIKEETEIDFYNIKLEYLPTEVIGKDKDGNPFIVKEGIKANNLALIMEFIEGEPEDG